MRLRTRHSRILTAAVAASVGGSVGSALPAHAHQFDNDGTWTDEHVLQVGGAVTQGNVVGHWQKRLYLEALAHGHPQTFPCEEVDGIFGPVTESATRHWQQFRGLSSVDGIVGPETWTSAKNLLTEIGPTGDGWTLWDWGFAGGADTMRNGFGTWQWQGPATADYINTNHPSVTFAKC